MQLSPLPLALTSALLIAPLQACIYAGHELPACDAGGSDSAAAASPSLQVEGGDADQGTAGDPTPASSSGDTASRPAGDPGGTAGDTGPVGGDPTASAGGDPTVSAGGADVTFTVDAAADTHPISPWVYGINNGIPADLAGSVSLDRFGGNRLTAYNWENNASNAGSDYDFSSDNYLCSEVGCADSNAPGEAVRMSVEAARASGAGIIITVPILGKVAADKNGSVSSSDVASRFVDSVARKPGAFTLTPDPTDGTVYQDEFINWLVHTFPDATSDTTHPIFISLDNEPGLWSSTHALIHPNATGYEELRQKTVDYATAIKDVLPSATIFGPALFGWYAYVTLNNPTDNQTYGDFIDWFLDAMQSADTTGGRRLLDVLDLHWYPEAQGGGVRITLGGEDTNTPAVVAARLQAPRSLWDPNYVETSWITDATGGPIRLLPLMREKIAAHYPGTKLAITEYNYGGGGDISGGIAEADVLGIFGRESLFAANFWHLGNSDDRYIHAAYEMFRNYDGQGGSFGDTSVRAVASDDAKVSVYASLDSTDPQRLVLVLLNKTNTSQHAAVSLHNAPAQLGHAEVYQLTAAAAAPQREADFALSGSAFTYDLPPMSVSTLVLLPGG